MKRRNGFTLVEMLVSVALVLLIMLLFAMAFDIAAGSIRTQRGVAENDQRARSITTILLGDLRKRTYRQREDAVTSTIAPSRGTQNAGDLQLLLLQNLANRNSRGILPLHPDYFNGGMSGASTRDVDTNRERGYFEYSEGEPADDSDDVLQFTVNMDITALGNDETTPLLGRARPLGGAGTSTFDNTSATGPVNPDQPIWDDGRGFQIDASGAPQSYTPGDTGSSQSRFAEISYFMRAGKLYRRVMLIRDPLSHMKDAEIGIGQPNVGPNGAGGAIIDATYQDEDGSPTPAGLGDFWNDFDFSAQFTTPVAPGGVNVYFADVASLDNTIGGVKNGAVPARFFALGNPQNRFGHDALARTLQGRPKEHYDPNNAATRFGRYTQEETSHVDFAYPGYDVYVGGTDSPMAPFALAGITDTNGNEVADLFENGPRKGEDILLSNCHGFDVKIWDDAVNQFVDVGHTTTLGGNRGDYHVGWLTDRSDPWTPGSNYAGRFQAAQRFMARYGSLNGENNRIFDTWHPSFDFDTTIPNANGDSSSADDVPPFRPLWSDRDTFTLPLASGGSGGAAPYLTGLRPTLYNPTTQYDAGDRVFPRPNQAVAFHGHQSFFYVATPNPASGTDGMNMAPNPATEPRWAESPCATTQDGQILWKAIANTVGMKAIQVTVRFYDQTSGQIRQLTLTHSFVE